MYPDIIDLLQQILELRKVHFFEQVLFSFNWWFLVVVSTVPWIIWAVWVDRKRRQAILLCGLLLMVLALLLDEFGTSLVLWDYQYNLIFFTSRFNPVDLTVLPVFFMFIYQFFGKWPSFLVAQLVFAAFAAFVAEPLFVWLNIYTMIQWEHLYSFPIYFVLGLIVKWVVDHITAD